MPNLTRNYLNRERTDRPSYAGTCLNDEYALEHSLGQKERKMSSPRVVLDNEEAKRLRELVKRVVDDISGPTSIRFQEAMISLVLADPESRRSAVKEAIVAARTVSNRA